MGVSSTEQTEPHFRQLLAENIPEVLQLIPQWVMHRGKQRPNGKFPKIPIDQQGQELSWSKSRNWMKYLDAVASHDQLKLSDGIGIVLAKKAQLTCLDLDGGYDLKTGELIPFASGIASEVMSYTEVSDSGRGLHIFAGGELPKALKLKDIELYDSNQFIAVTGNRLAQFPGCVHERHDIITAVYQRYCKKNKVTPPRLTASPMALDDYSLLEKARNAKNGSKFMRLWSGDWSGYVSQSEADMALLSMLAFWTGPDRDRMTSLFLESGLGKRLKARRPDYLPRTIGRVLITQTAYYDPTTNLHPVRPNTRHSNEHREGVLVLDSGIDLAGNSTQVAETLQSQEAFEGGVVANWPELLKRAKKLAKKNLPDTRGRCSPKMRLLAAVCLELQKLHGGRPFFLSCRVAEQHLGVDHSTAARYFTALRGRGLLTLVEQGTYQTRQGSTYWWTGEPAAAASRQSATREDMPMLGV